MFALAQPDHLRDRLGVIERFVMFVINLDWAPLHIVTSVRDFIVGKMSREAFTQQKTELLAALTKLKVELSEEEASFLETHSSGSMQQFTTVQDTVVIKDGLINNKK